MPSITLMISPMRCELCEISRMASMACCVSSLPWRASCADWPARELTSRTCSALCLAVAVISSTLAAVCSSAAACFSVRSDRSMLPAAIWREAAAMDPVDCTIVRKAACRRSCMRPIPSNRRPISPRWWCDTLPDKSPLATRSHSATASSKGPITCVRKKRNAPISSKASRPSVTPPWRHKVPVNAASTSST
ncbi:hypothetical protein D3C87_1330310 [compost metagenome]